MLSSYISLQAATILFLFAILSCLGKAQTGSPPVLAPLSTSDALKELADKERTLRQEFEKLNQRIESGEKWTQATLSSTASHSQSVQQTATNQIYICTAIVLFLTILLGFNSYQIRNDTRDVTNKLNTLSEATATQIKHVEVLEQKLQDEVVSITGTNQKQETKLGELEKALKKAEELVQKMETVVKSHQPPNKIKRDLIAILLYYNWPDEYRTRLANALLDWNGDGQKEHPQLVLENAESPKVASIITPESKTVENS